MLASVVDGKPILDQHWMNSNNMNIYPPPFHLNKMHKDGVDYLNNLATVG